MVIWRGWGFLTLFFILGIFGLTSGVIEPIYRSQTGFEYVYNAEKLVMGGSATILIALVLAAFVWFVLPWMELVPTTEQGRESLRQAKAAGVTEFPRPKPWKTRSSFFFIPMWVLPIVFVALGVLLIVLNMGTAAAEIAVREGA